MATKQRRCLGVDIGSSSVKVAELALTKTGISIEKVAGAPLDLPPGTPENERATTIVKTLRKLLKTHKISCRTAVFAVPGQQTFLRRLPPLPKTSPERIRRLLEYEADKLVPFPPAQSLRRFQIVEIPETGEYEVLLAAMKREQIEQTMKLISRSGLKPVQISVGPLSLHNFYRFTETTYVSPEEKKLREKEEARLNAQEAKATAEAAKGKKGKKSKKAKAAKDEEPKKKGFSLGSLFSKKKKADAEADEAIDEAIDEADVEDVEGEEESELSPEVQAILDEEFHEVVAYVSIGARNLDLSIPRVDGDLPYGFTRSVPKAGDEMTMAIMRAKGLASFTDAEELKLTKAAVVDPDLGEDLMPEGVDPVACVAATKVVDDMLIELRRSLDFYISQPDGVAVDRIALSGGASALPGLRERMEERLGVDVEITTAIDSCDHLTQSSEITESLAAYVMAAGQAIEGLEYGELTIDFLPEEYQVMRALKKKQAALFAMAACLGGMVALSTQIGGKGARLYRQAEGELQGQIMMYRSQNWKQKYEDAVETRENLKEDYDALQAAFTFDSDLPYEFLAYLQTKKPDNIVLTKVDLDVVGKVTIEGLAQSETAHFQFVQDLRADTELVLKCEGGSSMPATSNRSLLPGATHQFEISMWINKTARTLTPGARLPGPGGPMGNPMGIPSS